MSLVFGCNIVSKRPELFRTFLITKQGTERLVFQLNTHLEVEKFLVGALMRGYKL